MTVLVSLAPPLALESFTPLAPIGPVDLYTGFDDDDFISIALPDFPLSNVDLANSFVRFGANTTIDTSTSTSSVAFSSNLNTWVAGDNEFRFKRELLFSGLAGDARVDALKSVKAVKFTVKTTADCTFRCLAIRLVGKDWKYSPLDIDTRYQRAERPAPPNGSLVKASDFPTSSLTSMAQDWPVLFWADEPSGKSDPRPIDVSVTTAFNSGSLTTASGNTAYAVRLTRPGMINVGDPTNLRFTTAFSLEMWIKPDSLSTNQALIGKYQDVNGSRAFRWVLLSTGEMRLDLSTGTDVVASTSVGATITAGQWSHVGVKYSAGTVTFYKSGNPLNVDVTGMNSVLGANGRPFQIGAALTLDGYQGYLDEIAVFGTALPDARFKAHYQTAIASPGNESVPILADSPAGYWRVEDESSVAVDSSGHGNNGTYTPIADVTLRQASVAPVTQNQIVLYLREEPRPVFKQLDLDGGSWTQARLDGLGQQPQIPITHTTGALTLPSATVAVDSTIGFATSGYIVVEEQLIAYTGRTGTSFTGCSGGVGAISVGTEVTTTTFLPRPQSDLDLAEQSELDATTQINLDEITDTGQTTWAEIRLAWDAVGSTLSIKDSIGDGYTFTDFQLEAHTDYIMFADLEEEQLRVRIYPLDSNDTSPTASTTGEILFDQMVYDTTVVVDSNILRRRRGRVGWYASFADGDCLIYSIRPRNLSFAEWRSHPLKSISPVEGAQVFVGSAPDRQLFDGWVRGPHGGNIVPDTQKSNSGESFRVSNDGTQPLQGIASIPKYYDTFENIEISFSLNYPRTALTQGADLSAFLFGEFARVIPLRLPDITPDKWQHIKILLNELEHYQTGYYSFVLLQSVNGVITNWYIDKMSILQRAMVWEGRSRADDAWGDFTHEWMPFRDTLNDGQGGVIFSTRERDLQIRGKALAQDGYIDNVRIIPRYTEPGRFVWSDERLTGIPTPTPIINLSNTTLTSNLSSGAGTITVASTQEYPDKGTLRIEGEFVTYTGRTTHTFTGCTRGAEGTQQAAHTSGAVVYGWPVLFDGTSSSGQNFIGNYRWTFGDGKESYGPVVTHEYEGPGTYTVALSVTDSYGQVASTYKVITL